MREVFMNFRPTTLLFVAIFSLPSLAADKSGKFTVLSMGTKSCGEVVSDFKEDGRGKLINEVWVAGYLSDINERVATRSNIAVGTDPAAWNLWINNYCSANPLESLSPTISLLVGELSQRRH
jgi:hypothetical protein